MSESIVRCLHDKLVHTEDLKQHPKNHNKHSKDQIDRLAKILEYQGWRYPIKVSKQTGFITSGHGRLEAAKLNNWTVVPVNFQDYESEEQEYADIQSDNAIALWAELDLSGINADIGDLGPDFDIDLLGIKDFVLEPADKIPQCDEDEVPGHVEPKTKLGDLYRLGEHRLLCGDSTSVDAVEKLMEGSKADMLCWDPPWNVGFEYNKYQDDKLSSDYGLFIKDCLNNFSIVSKESYIAVVWQSEKNWQYFHEWFPKEARMVAVAKNFVQLSGGFLQRAWDPAFMFHGPMYEHPKSKKHNQRDYFLSNTAATYDDGSGIRVTAGAHPCPRQVDVCEYFITGWSKAGFNVLDLCGGSGTTLIACEKTNRKCFMMEIDPHYCDVIIARWEKYTGKKAEPLNG